MKPPPSNVSVLITAFLFLYLFSAPMVVLIVKSTPLKNSKKTAAAFGYFYLPVIFLYEKCPPYKRAIDLELKWLHLE